MWPCLVVTIVIGSLAGVRGQIPHFSYNNCARPNTTRTAEGVTDPQPDLPTLPPTFQVRVEANIVNGQRTVEATEYVDRPNNRAALRTVVNNTMDYMIADNTNNQIIYSINDSCYADTLKNDNNNLMFDINTHSSTPHFYSTTGVLQIALSNGLTYMGQNTIRGIAVDHWLSCMYWPQMLANFTLDFYWSSVGWTDSVLYPRVPVRAVVMGQAFGSNLAFHNFKHIYEYYDFRDHIWGDSSVFETPKGVVCKNRKQTRRVPQLNSQISYREEILNMDDKQVAQSDVWYDYRSRLVRYDYRPIGPFYPTYSTDVLSQIHDYNTGIAYFIDRNYGNCSVLPIASGSLATATNMSSGQRPQPILQMQSPSGFFYLDNTTYTYEGKQTVRGMPCDVFISRRTDFSIPGVLPFNSTFEFYYLDKSWVSVNNLGRNKSAVTDIPIRLEITTSVQVGFHTIYNFYDFNEEDVSVNNFNIMPCFSAASRTTFVITFPESLDASLLVFKANFLTAIIDNLSRVGHVSKIRIQRADFHMDADNAYFVGTLLGLPPSVAYFQKLPGHYQRYSNDKSATVVDAASCADRCNDGTSLPGCNSFDYCASKRLCTLSRTHTEDGQVLDTQSQCDHYSRTTGHPDLQTSMGAAWEAIRNTVYSGRFRISVNIGQGGTKVYTAKSVTDKIKLNGQRNPALQTTLSNFDMRPNKMVPGYDAATLKGLAVDDCAAACMQRQDWVCNSFEYQYMTSICTLSTLHPDERASSVFNSIFTDLYTRKYTAQYEKIPGVTVLPQALSIYENIYTADLCAKLCSNHHGFSCLSFDYCDDLSICTLGRTHYYDAPKANIHVAPACNHYSRNYLYDFKQTSQRRLANVANRVITGVGVTQCAKLCVQQEQTACASFGYCGNVTTCRLTTDSMRNTGQTTTVADMWCDVYSRQTLPDGTPYVYHPPRQSTTPPLPGSNASLPTSVSNNSFAPTAGSNKYPPTTPTSTRSTSGPTLRSANYSSLPSTSGKYSGGAMAGIAFGMFIAGILITVGTIVLLVKLRARPVESIKVAFIKEDESVYTQ